MKMNPTELARMAQRQAALHGVQHHARLHHGSAKHGAAQCDPAQPGCHRPVRDKRSAWHVLRHWLMAGHGPQGAGGGRGRGAWDGDDHPNWTRGRKFGAEDLQLMLLGILEENPSHGYELIKALTTLSQGFYTPSPGMVYPALTFLEDVGYATVALDGSKKRYHLADPGRAYLDANRDRLALLLGKLKHAARKMEWMQRAWSGEQPDLDADGADRATGWLPEFVQARQALKTALVERGDIPAAEQRRIAAILQRAAAQIRDPQLT